MRSTFLLLGFVLCSLTSCKKYSIVHENINGTIAAGIGRSSWIINIKNNEFIEPMNLNSFNVTLKAGQAVIFSYFEDPHASLCMMGMTVELISIKDR